MRSWLLAVGVLALAVPATFQAQEQPLLQGFFGVRVVIGTLDEDARDVGLSEASLRTAVELRLRQSGITVDTQSPFALYVRLSVLETSGIEGYVFAHELKLEEAILLVRRVGEAVRNTDGTEKTLLEHWIESPGYRVFTWETGGIGTAPPDTARRLIRELLLEDVDEFANDYLAANPR